MERAVLVARTLDMTAIIGGLNGELAFGRCGV